MKFLRITLISFFIALPLSNAKASDMNDLLSLLASTKMTGTCEVLDQLVEFQAKSQMEGSEEFVATFWQAEADRRNLTVEELTAQCNTAVTTFGRMWQAIEETTLEGENP